MEYDVFISYSHPDKAAADAACATLEQAGIRCWIAPRDIVPGMDWGESIVTAITGAKVLVLIFSQHANESPQIKREVERAVAKGLPIIPVRIEDTVPSKALEYFISTPHWLDAFTPPLEERLTQLAAAVKALLGTIQPEGEGRAGLARSRRKARRRAGSCGWRQSSWTPIARCRFWQSPSAHAALLSWAPPSLPWRDSLERRS